MMLGCLDEEELVGSLFVRIFIVRLIKLGNSIP